MIRKYKLAILENYTSRFFGRKLRHVYFVVVTLLFMNYFRCGKGYFFPESTLVSLILSLTLKNRLPSIKMLGFLLSFSDSRRETDFFSLSRYNELAEKAIEFYSSISFY